MEVWAVTAIGHNDRRRNDTLNVPSPRRSRSRREVEARSRRNEVGTFAPAELSDAKGGAESQRVDGDEDEETMNRRMVGGDRRRRWICGVVGFFAADDDDDARKLTAAVERGKSFVLAPRWARLSKIMYTSTARVCQNSRRSRRA